ncbi:hypothetical protein EVAR_93971_1 [Eumeta japonica]|uniref:Uncharacterized protein n=1 Tax=Eumeta variegata TaxID=151549 RepID=A0A4C1TPA7_EUMVA|nr:hypothetical protein EVAR_93971_1 [Eumeta japonica]
MRQNAVVLDYDENKLVFNKKGLHAPLVSHAPARTAQKLASAVMTYFVDWVDKNEKYLSVCNLALILMPEKQWKEVISDQGTVFCSRMVKAPTRSEHSGQYCDSLLRLTRRQMMLKTLEGGVELKGYWPSHCGSVVADIF